ncbi:MAG: toll/interleukin-1 receptor domain-containing protein, partial [Opitutaceae bacterium]|nr:toll/interleukin-1 receptor domain-containing protein [Opitutaceae bacterium]
MSASVNKAVFLSYASQDAEAARRICETLRGAGMEVWLDADGGLEHGDEWDAKIRRQIKECVLFIPLISTNTQARHEGYFRIEWELAAERAMGFASGVAFVLPIAIDATRESDALVPDRFRKVQWTRAQGGELPPEVLARFLKLWSYRTGALKHQSDVGRGRRTPPSGNAADETAGFGDPALQ